MTYWTRGQSGGNTATSVTTSKSTLLTSLLRQGRRPRRTFERRKGEPFADTSTMTSGAKYPPDRRPPFTPGMKSRDSSPTTLRCNAPTKCLPITGPLRGMSAESMRHGPRRCRQLGTWTLSTCAIRTSCAYADIRVHPREYHLSSACYNSQLRDLSRDFSAENCRKVGHMESQRAYSVFPSVLMLSQSHL
jgi:hypothetical protein